VAAGNVYTSFASAVTAANTNGGGTLLIDSSLGSPVAPSGTYDLSNITLVGAFNASATTTLNFQNGATISKIWAGVEFLTIISTSSSVICTLDGFNTVFIGHGASVAGDSASIAFFSVPASTTSTVELDSESALGDGTVAAITAATGSTCNINVQFGSTVNANSLIGLGTAAISADVTCTVSATQGITTKTITTPAMSAALPAGNNNITGLKNVTFNSEASSTGVGAQTIDWSAAQKRVFTFSSNATATFTFTAPAGVCNLTLRVVQFSTGGQTVTWPATVKWVGGAAPTLTATNSAVDIVTFLWNGTNYYGVASLNFA
jgi:hypothetical protein